jgi:Ulp1 family protease
MVNKLDAPLVDQWTTTKRRHPYRPRQMSSEQFCSLSPTTLSILFISILIYPFTGTGGVVVKNSDLQRLDPGEFLNDVVIEVALK